MRILFIASFVFLQFSVVAQILTSFGNNQHDSADITTVYDAEIYNGNLYLGGEFYLINGVAVKAICKYDGTTTIPITTSIGSVYDMEIFKNKLYIAYRGPAAGVAFWNDTILQYTSLSGLTGNSAIHSLKAHNGNLYATGSFEVNNQYYILAKYDGANWTYHGTSSFIKSTGVSIAVYYNDILLSGGFDTINNTYFASSILRFDGTNFHSFNSAYSLGTSLIVDGNSVVEGLRKRSTDPSPFVHTNGTNYSFLTDTIFTNAIAGRVFSTNGLEFYSSVDNRITSGQVPTSSAFLYLKVGQNFTPLCDSLFGVAQPWITITLPENLIRGVVFYNGQWILYGGFKSTSAFATYPQNMLAVIVGSLNVTEETSDKSTFFVYPNPVQNFLMLSGEIKNTPFLIYNAQGSIVLKGFTGSKINVSTLQKGFYIFELQQENNVTQKPFIKSN